MKLGNSKDYILPVGNLKTKRIVIDVRDTVRAYYELMKNFSDKMNGQAFNVCGEIEDVKEMEYFTDKLIEISGLPRVEKRIHKAIYRPIDIEVQIGSTDKINNYINWEKSYNLDNTLNDLFNYWIKKLSK